MTRLDAEFGENVAADIRMVRTKSIRPQAGENQTKKRRGIKKLALEGSSRCHKNSADESSELSGISFFGFSKLSSVEVCKAAL